MPRTLVSVLIVEMCRHHAPSIALGLSLVSCVASPSAEPSSARRTQARASVVPPAEPTRQRAVVPTATGELVTAVHIADDASPGTELSAWVEPLRRVLMARDSAVLARFAHPTRGVRFSPYAYVSGDDVTLSNAELKRGFETDARRLWGSYDGSGEDIRLTFAEYWERFVRVPKPERARHSVDRTLAGGNTANNLREFYPGAHFIEFHHPGSDPRYEGMDWQSVRFVLMREGQQLWLVAVVHDQWTI